MASNSKSRQPRLRASCDGCFLAKVKCSKARPICSRCLACGIECRYSPSSRAGKPKSDSHSNINHSNPNHHDMRVEDQNIAYNRPSEHLFKIETGWTTPPTSVDGSMSRNPSISTNLSLVGVEDASMGEHDPMSAPTDMYPASLPWTPPTDLTCAPYGDVVTVGHMPGSHVRSQSFDLSMSGSLGWADPSNHDMMAYSQLPTPVSMSANYFPSPTATPQIRPANSRQRSSPPSSGGSCACFTVCLQSLQALHNASSPASSPFDLVLSLNRKAVEGCASMLACSKCVGCSGNHTAAMLLTTLIGKITSFYRQASSAYFDNGTMGSVSLGVYQLNGEDGRWLELEILARELRKLEEVYARFREVCAELSDDPEVSKAVIGYLGHSLGSTLEVLNHRKAGDMTFA